MISINFSFLRNSSSGGRRHYPCFIYNKDLIYNFDNNIYYLKVYYFIKLFYILYLSKLKLEKILFVCVLIYQILICRVFIVSNI